MNGFAAGASEDIQSNAMTQLTKAVSTNKMEMDTWMSIQQAMPGQIDQVAKSMLGQSASASDLYQAMKDGRITVSDFADAVVDLDKNGADGITSFSVKPLRLITTLGLIRDVKSRLQRTNPVEHRTEYNQLFTRFLELETQRQQLQQQSIGLSE